MSTSVKAADLSITIVVAILKLAGLGPEADRFLDAIEGAKNCINLIDDIKNEIVSDPNKDLIRSLFRAMEEEVRSIKADLKVQGLGRDEIESTADVLIETTRVTVKHLAQDDDSLLDAARLPDKFFTILVHRAEPLPDWCDDTISTLYRRLLKRVSEEFVARAQNFDRFDEVALASLLRDNLSAKKQRNRIERGVQENRAINVETNRIVKEDRDTGLETNQLVKELVQRRPYSISSRVFFGSRPDVVAENRFVERSEQEQLNALISDQTRQRTVLVGMRGCGKSQLASALAQQCEDKNWSLVAWVNAGSPESITSDLVELAKELKKELKIDTSDQPTPKTIIRRLFNRLKSADPSDRLIVFDNVENIDDLRRLVPSANGLRVVATTTNNTGWGHQGWDTIKVGVFGRDKSISYLLTATASTDHDTADKLADRLGDLPLALAQAAATARNGDLSLVQYLDRLDSYRSERVIRPVPGDYYTDDVATALCMAIEDAFENLEDDTKKAAQRQLGALALLAESGVPTRWLDPTIEQQDDREVHDTNRAEDETAHEALTELIHRSIIQQSADKATTMLHRLQAQVLRESWNEQDNKEALESAAALLRSVSINKFSRNATALRRRETLDLIEQLRAIGEQRHSQLLFTLRTITASLFQGFSHAHDLGLACAALTLEISANSLENTPALDPYERLNLHICLAQAYQAAGNLPKAIYRYRQVLEVCTRTFGKGDPRTLSCRNYLASAYQAAGNLPEAIYLYEQVLRDTPPIVGKYHPNTLNTRISLASAYQEVGDIHKAIDRYKQVCKDCIKALGENHPETLRSRINLAYAYQEAGDVDKAISSYEQLLQDCTRILGQDHPHTLTTRNNLASAYESAGHKAESISSYEQLLQDCTRILGQEHPHTLATRNNLAHSYALAGDIPKALEHWLKTYADCQHILGHHHPLTKAVHKNVATADQQLKQQEEDSAAE